MDKYIKPENLREYHKDYYRTRTYLGKIPNPACDHVWRLLTGPGPMNHLPTQICPYCMGLKQDD